MFPKNQWIDFEYETEMLGETYHVRAQGWVSSDGITETQVKVRQVQHSIEGGSFIPYVPNGLEFIKLTEDAYEYFVINYVANSFPMEIE